MSRSPRSSPLIRDSSPPLSPPERVSRTPSLAASFSRRSLLADCGGVVADDHEPFLTLPAGLDEDGDRQEHRSGLYLVLLTLGLGGLQMAWSVELSNGSPYLMSLGLSKSLMALVWVAGPLSGILVQPYVGALSDQCQLRWGKRRPFMVAGTAATVVSLMLLAWTREIVMHFLGMFGAPPGSDLVRVSVMITAVAGVYILDFSINVVQAATRAFIVDGAPAHQQEAANAMASRALGVGNIVGFVAGYVKLQPYLGFLGDSQFKILCAMASLALTVTIALSVALIHERDPRLDGLGPAARRREANAELMASAACKRGRCGRFASCFSVNGALGLFLARLARSMRRLPPQVKIVCMAELFAFIGLFPFLFYTSSYVGELYVQPFLERKPHMPAEELDQLYEKATRVGTYALLVNSVVSLILNLVLPILVTPTYDREVHSLGVDVPTDGLLERLRIPWLTLRRTWLLSLLVFAVAMVCTLVVRSVAAATALFGLAGFTWAMTLWAPYAIISAEMSLRDASARGRRGRAMAIIDSDDDVDINAALSTILDGPDDDAMADDDEDQVGVVMGIHNMAVAAPQVVATIGSSIAFRLWQKPRGTPGDHSLAIVLASGGLAVLGAVYHVARLREDRPADVAVAAENGRSTSVVGAPRPKIL